MLFRTITILVNVFISILCDGQTLDVGYINFEDKSVNEIYTTYKILQESELEKEDTLNELDGYYLHFLPIELERKTKVLEIDLSKYKYEAIKDTNGTIDRVEIDYDYVYRERYTEPLVKDYKIEYCCIWEKTPYSLTIEFGSVDRLYKTIRLEVNKQDIIEGRKLHEIEVEILEIKKAPSVFCSREPITRITKNLPYSKMVYLEDSNWSVFSRKNCSVDMRHFENISSIQTALRVRGYKVPLTNVLDEETKLALIKFQRDNNLEVGTLDLVTLKKLEIKDFRVREYEWIKKEN